MTDVFLITPRKGTWNGIDLLRLWMAFCVTAIHTDPFGAFTDTIWYAVYDSVVRTAVPFFFLASGFLLGVRMRAPFAASENVPQIRAFLWKFIKLYLLWSALYLPLAVIGAHSAGRPLVKSILLYFHALIFLGEHHNSWQLWYLLATVYVSLLLYLFIRRRVPFSVTVGICFALYAVGLFMDWLHGQESVSPPLQAVQSLLAHTFVYGRMFQGFLFLPLGMLLSRKTLRSGAAVFLAVAGLAAGALLANGTLKALVGAAAAVGLFCNAQAFPLRDSRLYPIARHMSAAIYYIHMYVWTILYWILYREKAFGLRMFVYTAAVSTVAALAYALLREKLRFRKTHPAADGKTG